MTILSAGFCAGRVGKIGREQFETRNLSASSALDCCALTNRRVATLNPLVNRLLANLASGREISNAVDDTDGLGQWSMRMIFHAAIKPQIDFIFNLRLVEFIR